MQNLSDLRERLGFHHRIAKSEHLPAPTYGVYMKGVLKMWHKITVKVDNEGQPASACVEKVVFHIN